MYRNILNFKQIYPDEFFYGQLTMQSQQILLDSIHNYRYVSSLFDQHERANVL